MPIYEYECRKCHAHTEVMQKISDKPLTKCRKCGGRLDKQWSSTSFQLKGSGWYATDYAAKKSEAKEEKPAAGAEDKKEEKSAPAKTETATSDKPAAPTKKNASKTTSSNTGD
ncbi:MAG TPA: zinc ribbon domain-containing protein [Pyrinomonadaceae bacterium]|jgi:putative FmdB family regulatory protein